MATKSAWGMISTCPSAIAPARLCNGRRNLTRDSQNQTSLSCRLSAMEPTATSTSMPRSSGAIRIRYSTGPSASSACARKFRKSAGATLKCFRLEIRWCSQSATTGATIQSCLSIIWMRFPGRWPSPLDCEGNEARVLVNLLTEDHSRAGEDGRHHLLLEAYGYRWYRVGGLDYLLKRSEIEMPKAR